MQKIKLFENEPQKIEAVVSRFALIAGLSPHELPSWRHLCENSLKSLGNQIKPEAVRDQGNCERIITTAAAFAYADYLVLNGEFSQSDEIKVGDISIKNSAPSGNKSNAHKIRSYFKSQIADLLSPNEFAFLVVGEVHAT